MRLIKPLDFTLTRRSLCSSCWHITHKAAMKSDGGSISSANLTKMKNDVWAEPLTPPKKCLSPGVKKIME